MKNTAVLHLSVFHLCGCFSSFCFSSFSNMIVLSYVHAHYSWVCLVLLSYFSMTNLMSEMTVLYSHRILQGDKYFYAYKCYFITSVLDQGLISAWKLYTQEELSTKL